MACHVVTRNDDKRTSIEPVLPGCVPCSFIPDGVDDGVPVATITHELGSHVFQFVGGGVALVVTQTLQGVTTIGQAPPAVAVGTFESHGAAMRARSRLIAVQIVDKKTSIATASTWLCDRFILAIVNLLPRHHSRSWSVSHHHADSAGSCHNHSCSSHSSGWYFLTACVVCSHRLFACVSTFSASTSWTGTRFSCDGGCCTEDRWLEH